MLDPNARCETWLLGSCRGGIGLIGAAAAGALVSSFTGRREAAMTNYCLWCGARLVTAACEVAEETGLTVAIVRLLDVSYGQDDPRKRVNVIAYLAKVVAGELCAADDAEQARFFALDALPSDLAFANNRAILARLAAEHPTGDLT